MIPISDADRQVPGGGAPSGMRSVPAVSRIRRGRPGGSLAIAASLLLSACGGDGGAAQERLATPRTLADGTPGCRFLASGVDLVERQSPPDSSMAVVDGTTVKVCYGRPSMRGREILGGLVPFGEPWRLGANEPTMLHLTGPVRFGDLRLEAGTYTLYAVPGPERWEVVVNRQVARWGTPIDEGVREHDLGSVTVATHETEAPVESLSIELVPPDGEGGGTEMVVAWERTRVEIPLRPAGTNAS